jgi:hypothetical protein
MCRCLLLSPNGFPERGLSTVGSRFTFLFCCPLFSSDVDTKQKVRTFSTRNRTALLPQPRLNTATPILSHPSFYFCLAAYKRVKLSIILFQPTETKRKFTKKSLINIQYRTTTTIRSLSTHTQKRISLSYINRSEP